VKFSEALEYLGSKAAVAKAAGVSRQAIAQWGDGIPLPAAIAIQWRTFGRLKVDLALYGHLATLGDIEMVLRERKR